MECNVGLQKVVDILNRDALFGKITHLLGKEKYIASNPCGVNRTSCINGTEENKSE